MTTGEVTREQQMPKSLGADRPRVTLLIIALNEAENLPHVISRIPPLVDEVWLVDGHSTDATIAVAKALRADIHVAYQEGCHKMRYQSCQWRYYRDY